MADHSLSGNPRSKGRFNQGSIREWLVPVALIAVTSGFVFLATSVLDFGEDNSIRSFWETLFFSDKSSAAGDVASLA